MIYDAVIFDWDGVITDSTSVKTEAFIELFASAGSEIQNKIREHQKTSGGISRFKKYQFYMEEFLHQKVSAAQLDNFGKKYSAMIHQKLLQTPFIDGVLETLAQLHHLKIPAFVATGSPAEEIYKLAEIRKIKHYFTEIYGSPSTKDLIIKQILEKYGFSPAKTVFFGDAIADYNAAQKNNINFIGIVPQLISSPFPPQTQIQSNVKLKFQ